MLLNFSRIAVLNALLCCFFAVTGCSDGGGDPPEVVNPPINVSYRFQAKGLRVSFQITNPRDLSPSETVLWSFGDGGQANDANPVHFFESPGTYDVSVKLTDSTLRETEDRQTITVDVLPSCGLDWVSEAGPSFDGIVHLVGGAPGFVAAGSGVLFSGNGFDWCDVQVARGEAISDIFWKDGRFWAVANGSYNDGTQQQYSQILKSENGRDWTWETGPDAYVEDLYFYKGQMIAIGFVSDEYGIYLKPTGQPWQQVLQSEAPLVTSVITPSGDLHIYGSSPQNSVSGSADLLWTSSNGLDYAAVTTSERLFYRLLAGNSQRLVRISDRIETSTDGLAWTSVDVTLPEVMGQLVWNGQQFVAIGANTAMISTDGLRWEVESLPETFELEVSRLVSDGTIWIIADEFGPKLWSQSGFTWRAMPTNLAPPASRIWADVTGQDDDFVVGGYRLAEGGVLEGSYVRESEDGLSLEESSVSYGFAVHAAAQTSLGLVTAGSKDIFSTFGGGVFLRSAGGWAEVLKTKDPLFYLAFKEKLLLVFDIAGKVFRSVDGLSWQEGQVLGALQQVGTVGDAFMALTAGGRLFRSQDGLVWQEIALPETLGHARAFAGRQDVFLVSADTGRPNPSTWAYTEDFQKWSVYQLPYATSFRALTASETGFYAAGAFAPGADGAARSLPHASVIFSSDGVNWEVESAPNVTMLRIAAGETQALGINNQRIFRRNAR